MLLISTTEGLNDVTTSMNCYMQMKIFNKSLDNDISCVDREWKDELITVLEFVKIKIAVGNLD